MANLLDNNGRPGLPEITVSMFHGLCMAVLALANELDQKGALSIERYRESLDELRATMPVAEAGVGAGTIFEVMIDRLDERIARKQKG